MLFQTPNTSPASRRKAPGADQARDVGRLPVLNIMGLMGFEIEASCIRALSACKKWMVFLVSQVGVNNSIICVLDDDASFVQATGQLLSSVGLATEKFTDPYAFLGYARTHRPRLAIIDISMPAMNGLEVQTRLRTLSPSTRVIVLTARDDSSVRREAVAGGALAFFLKAGSEEELVAAVQSVLP